MGSSEGLHLRCLCDIRVGLSFEGRSWSSRCSIAATMLTPGRPNPQPPDGTAGRGAMDRGPAPLGRGAAGRGGEFDFSLPLPLDFGPDQPDQPDDYDDYD